MTVYLVERNFTGELFGPIVLAFVSEDEAERYAKLRHGCTVKPVELRGIDERFIHLASRALGFQLVA